MSDWQPIETAPLDGSWVDLWVVDWNGNGKRITSCIYWDEKWMTFVFPDHFPAIDDCVDVFVKDDEYKPTHWMPLPAAPTSDEAAA